MATTPRRTTQTPGAKKETTTTAQISTDDVMDAVLGKASVPTEETQTTEPESSENQTQPDPDDLPAFDLDQLLTNQVAILDNQARIEAKLDQLLQAGGIEAPKKKRWVQGKKGLELKEV